MFEQSCRCVRSRYPRSRYALRFGSAALLAILIGGGCNGPSQWTFLRPSHAPHTARTPHAPHSWRAPHAAHSSQAPTYAPVERGSSQRVAQQVEHGTQVYARSCAACHGDAGQGTDMAPLLAGSGALPLRPRPGSERSAQFHTALDVAAFATKTMPPDADDRAQLTERDYWAVLAFALTANGVQLPEPVGPGNAGDIVLHP